MMSSLSCFICLLYNNIHTPTSSWGDALATLFHVLGDQPRTNQIHSRWGGWGVPATHSPDTPPPSIQKGKEERKTIFLAIANDPLAYSTHRGDSLPLLQQVPWTKNLQGTFSLVPSFAAAKFPRSGLDVPHGWIILKFKNWMSDETT